MKLRLHALLFLVAVAVPVQQVHARSAAVAPDAACDAVGCLRAATHVGDYGKEVLAPYVPAGLSIDNGYTIYTLTYLTAGEEARATVAVPYGVRPPPAGYHVVANNHGTTGVGDPCALSGTIAGAGLAGLFGARGMIGVAVDYPGLGTPGVHPYMVAESEARAVLDGLRAVRALAAWKGIPLTNRFAVVGMSQGGHATLSAAALHREYAPELDIRGFAAAAPAIAWEEHWRAGLTDGSHLVYHALLLYAWSVHYKYKGPSIWGDGVRATIADEMEKYCAWSPRGEPTLATRLPAKASELFAPAFLAAFKSGQWGDYAAFHDWFTRNRVKPYKQTAPLRIFQGDADVYVPEWTTKQMVAALEKGGVKVEYESVPKGEHLNTAFGFLAAKEMGTTSSLAWVRARLDSK